MKYMIFILLTLMGKVSSAQSNQMGEVSYKLITNLTGDSSKKIQAQAILSFSNESSFYKTGLYKNLVSEDTTEIIQSNDEDKIESVYISFKESQMISRQFAFTELVWVGSNLDKIDWKLLPQRKVIASFVCHRAEGKVRGRLYTDWFAPDIPTNAGPWKLNGLPGVILEAVDSENKVKFVADKVSLFNKSSINSTLIKPTTKQKVLNEPEFLKVMRVNKDNFIKMIKSRPGVEGDFNVDIKSIEIYPEK